MTKTDWATVAVLAVGVVFAARVWKQYRGAQANQSATEAYGTALGNSQWLSGTGSLYEANPSSVFADGGMPGFSPV